jgi:3-deoxy-alpha-D-manno-octulosonate 8-oxidase
VKDALDTDVRNARNVNRYIFGKRAIQELGGILSLRRKSMAGQVVFLVDEFFETHPQTLGDLPSEDHDQMIYIPTHDEPTTGFVDVVTEEVMSKGGGQACAIVGIGGGITLDIAKAVSNLLTNPGHAADYQGWDLVKVPGVYKVGIPTLSGTGAEATRTCIMTNHENGLKLGMNSDHTVFDQLILDPDLTSTVPAQQYFFSGMDAWIHCVEALRGSYRNPVGDAFSMQAISLCREVFGSDEMMSDENRAKLMVASYLGGCAIATSYVGVVHPFSAALSVVLGLHHCVANCVTMMAMESYYPTEYCEFIDFIDNQSVIIPQGVCGGLSDPEFDALYQAMIIHEKPLTNALGERYRTILNKARARELFESM